MINVIFKTTSGDEIILTTDDSCPMGLVRIDTTISKHNVTMPISLEHFTEQNEDKDIWMSELDKYYFVDGEMLYNTITSMYESTNLTVSTDVFDIQKNPVNLLIMEAIEPEDENDKYSKRQLSIHFRKYDIHLTVRMRDIVSALEIVTYKKE